MEVVRDYPPLMDEIVRAFPMAANRGVIFCWGDRILAPTSTLVTAPLLAHEAVHSRQQNGDPWAWWREYIADVDFRLQQEIPAHIAELKVLWVGLTEKKRRMVLGRTAGKLSSPLYKYGRLFGYHEAWALLAKAMRAPLD
jgi:hypothetical protein